MRLNNRFLHLVVACLVCSVSTYVAPMEPPQKRARHDEYQREKGLILIGPLYKREETLLRLAVRFNQAEDARALLNDGVSPDCFTDCVTLLQQAIEHDSFEAAQLLIKKGAYLDRIPDYGSQRTPLMHAARLNRSRFIRLLMAAGADPTVHRGSPPLHIAVHHADKLDCVKALLCTTPMGAFLLRAKMLLMVFKRLSQHEGCGVSLPMDMQRYICRVYLTQCVLQKADKLCAHKNEFEKRAHYFCTSNDVERTRLVDPHDSTARKKVIWDAMGALMARTTQQEDNEHEIE